MNFSEAANTLAINGRIELGLPSPPSLLLEVKPMITALVAKPPPRTRTLEKTTSIDRLSPDRGRSQTDVDPSIIEQPDRTFEPPGVIDNYDEGRYLTKMILMMVVVLTLPALLMMVYLIFNPEALMYDITSGRDF